MKRIIFVLILILSLTISSCGGNGPTTELNVTLTDFQFTPNDFIVPAGQEITLNATNTGVVVHNFVIMKLGTTAGASFEEEDEGNVYWQEQDIPSGGDISVTFTAPTEPGEYEVICRTDGHIASGMVGKLVVVAEE